MWELCSKEPPSSITTQGLDDATLAFVCLYSGESEHSLNKMKVCTTTHKQDNTILL